YDALFVFFFFFSSRRRHTRLQGDWSSDVCSSDLVVCTTSRPPHRRRQSAVRTTSPTVLFDASPGGAVVGPAATTPLTHRAPRLALAPRTRRAIWARPRPLRPSPRGRRRPPLPPVRARA